MLSGPSGSHVQVMRSSARKTVTVVMVRPSENMHKSRAILDGESDQDSALNIFNNVHIHVGLYCTDSFGYAWDPTLPENKERESATGVYRGGHCRSRVHPRSTPSPPPPPPPPSYTAAAFTKGCEPVHQCEDLSGGSYDKVNNGCCGEFGSCIGKYFGCFDTKTQCETEYEHLREEQVENGCSSAKIGYAASPGRSSFAEDTFPPQQQCQRMYEDFIDQDSHIM